MSGTTTDTASSASTQVIKARSAPPYYATGANIFKSPVKNKNTDGSSSITLGFKVCTVSEFVDPADVVAFFIAAEQHEALVKALEEVVDLYCDLANSGDAGFWDPEKVEEIKHARAALASARGGE